MSSEQALLSFIENIGSTDFSFIIELIKYSFVAFWLVVLGWVWIDASERTSNVFAKIGALLVVGVLNVIGLVIYLLIRPKQSIQELYWSDLERRYLKYETLELGDCAKCRHSLQPGFNVCPRCGHQIKKQCGNCKVWVDKSYSYCPFCSSGFVNVIKPKVENVNESEEAMRAEVTKVQQEAIKVVEGNQTKYVVRDSFFSKVKNGATKFVKSVGDSVLAQKKASEQKKAQKQKEALRKKQEEDRVKEEAKKEELKKVEVAKKSKKHKKNKRKK